MAISTNCYAQSGGGAEGLVKNPRDKVTLVVSSGIAREAEGKCPWAPRLGGAKMSKPFNFFN